MRMLGIIMAYNDEDCIHNAIKCLLKANHEVHVFNHGSTDSTRNVILNYPVTLIDLNRNRWPNFTKNGQDNVHYAVTKHIQKNTLNYDWVSWIDADEILESHDHTPINNDIIRASEQGCVGIFSRLLNYWMTESDNQDEDNYLKRIYRYEDLGMHYSGGVFRSWDIKQTPTMTEATKRHTFLNGRPMSMHASLLHHYPVRTIDQAYNKINYDRQVTGGAGDHYRAEGYANTKSLMRPEKWGTVGDPNIILKAVDWVDAK